MNLLRRLYNRYIPFIRAVPFFFGGRVSLSISICNPAPITLLTFTLLSTACIPPYHISSHIHRWREMSDITTVGLWFDFISSRDCFMMIVWLYSWFDFISTRESVIHVFVFVSYSLDIGHVRGVAMAWLCVIHPPSIFTLFASPMVVLRPAIGRLSLRMLFVFLYSWFDFIIYERLVYQHCRITLFLVWFIIYERLFSYLNYILSTLFAEIGIIRLYTSAVHFHSFRFAGGSLTAAPPPFSENVVCISLFYWFDFIIFERLFYEHVVSLYSWFVFISSRDCFIDVLVFESYSLDIHYFMAMVMAWFGLLHPPSIFTRSASLVEVLRRRRRLSLRMLFVFLYSWFDFIIFERLVYQDVSLIGLVWFHIDERLVHWCISIWIPILSTFVMSMAWFGLIHPPSIFTLFASPVVVLRPAIGRISLRMLFL